MSYCQTYKVAILLCINYKQKASGNHFYNKECKLQKLCNWNWTFTLYIYIMHNIFFKYIQLRWKPRMSPPAWRDIKSPVCAHSTQKQTWNGHVFHPQAQKRPDVSLPEFQWTVSSHSPSFSNTCMLAFLFLSPGSLSVLAVTVCTSSSELSSSDEDDDDDDDDSSLLSDSSSSTRATSCRANTSGYYRRN